MRAVCVLVSPFTCCFKEANVLAFGILMACGGAAGWRRLRVNVSALLLQQRSVTAAEAQRVRRAGGFAGLTAAPGSGH